MSAAILGGGWAAIISQTHLSWSQGKSSICRRRSPNHPECCREPLLMSLQDALTTKKIKKNTGCTARNRHTLFKTVSTEVSAVLKHNPHTTQGSSFSLLQRDRLKYIEASVRWVQPVQIAFNLLKFGVLGHYFWPLISACLRPCASSCCWGLLTAERAAFQNTFRAEFIQMFTNLKTWLGFGDIVRRIPN